MVISKYRTCTGATRITFTGWGTVRKCLQIALEFLVFIPKHRWCSKYFFFYITVWCINFFFPQLIHIENILLVVAEEQVVA
jgi:hypothetical protein